MSVPVGQMGKKIIHSDHNSFKTNQMDILLITGNKYFLSQKLSMLFQMMALFTIHNLNIV